VSFSKDDGCGGGKWVRGRCGSGKRWNWVSGGHGTAKKERPIATPNIDRLNKNDIYNDIYQL